MLTDSKFHDYLLFVFIAIVFGCTLTTSSFFINKLYKNNIYIPKVELGSIKGLKNASDVGVKENITVESGDILPEIRDYFNSDDINLSFADIHYFNNNVELTVNDISFEENGIRYTSGVFDLRVVIQIKNKTYNTYLYIQDNTVPSFVLKDLVYDGSTDFNQYDFVDKYSDNSRSNIFSVSMSPTLADVSDKNGNYKIEVTVCDGNNNCDVGYSYLNINIPENETKNDKDSNSGKKPPKPNPKPNPNGNGNSGNGNQGGNGNSGNGDGGNGNSGDGGNGNQGGNDVTNPPGGSDVVTGIEDHYYSDDPSYNYTVSTCELPPVYPIDNNKPVKKTEKVYELLCSFKKYNATIKTYGYATYVHYTDGTKAIIKIDNLDYSVVANTFSATVADMKPEAMSLFDSLSSTRSVIIRKTNAYRNELGLVNLVEDNNLTIMATIRAIEIAYANRFSHTRPNGSSWATLFTEYGYTCGVVNGWTNKGENLASGYNEDEAAVLGWRNSQTHYQNMVTPEFRKIGVGKYTLYGKVYTVQLFST